MSELREITRVWAERLNEAINAALREEGERLVSRARAGLAHGDMMVAICEARDPFFPRHQDDDLDIDGPNNLEGSFKAEK
jgi:hypothetical protein